MYNETNYKNMALIGFGLLATVALIISGMSLSAQNSVATYEVDIPVAVSDLNILENRKVTLFTEMVSTIKASASKEEEILTNITALRSQGESLSSAISITAEAYPELKSIQNYNTFMTEIALTENGIATQRQFINKQIASYKKLFKVAPSKWFLDSSNMIDYPLYNVPVSKENPLDWSN